MDSLRIIAGGDSDGAKSNARGKLFEKIAAQVLRHNGYDIDEHQLNVTYAGMEIDIEGKARIAGIPLYAECKCYSSDVNCEKLQTFYGKYMTKWFKNDKAHGMFVALPGINSPAMGFYRDSCESNERITLRLLQEPDVLSALIDSGAVARPDVFQERIPKKCGTPGDRILICSDKGFFWLQCIVPRGSGIARVIQVFDSLGNPISDGETIDYLVGLLPEFQSFEVVRLTADPGRETTRQYEQVDDVVEVRGSSACFEYQFPAAPQFFVGRERLMEEIGEFFGKVTRRETSCRGILFEANSGWGKSSLVLATANSLKQRGHYALAVDSRSATSPHFVLSVVKHVLDTFGDFDGLVKNPPILGGFEAASDDLLQVGKELEGADKLLVIFFDQFENLFHLLDVLSRLAQLCLKVADAGTNVVLGFSWKTDLIGLTRDFPYRWRDTIIDACQGFRLPAFSETETNALLDRLAAELHTKLRKDLRFLLSEFSQGYPWLLKKLCAHVKSQRQAGVVQSEMVRALLNVEQLFLEDLQGLTTTQDEALRRIAKLAPVSISDVGDEFGPDVLQSLVDRRLVVKVASKYDIYWDIFRDYLNTGKLPIEEVYLLRAQVGSIMNALSILRDAPDGIGIAKFKTKAGLSDGAFFNVTRDLRLLQLAQIRDDVLVLSLPHAPDETTMIAGVRDHLKDRLPRNRCVHRVLRIIGDEGEADLARLAEILKLEFPYISAVKRTWETYARVLATWLDVSDLAILDQSNSKLLRHGRGSRLRERSLTFARRRSGITVPIIHFAPVVRVATRLISAVQRKEPVDWSGIRRSTVYKALSVLEELKLISRMSQVIYILPECHAFASDARRRTEIARDAVSRWPVFSDFLSILAEHSSTRLSLKELASELLERTGAAWKTSTALTNSKIMLDWARHLGLAGGPYAHTAWGQFRETSGPQEDMPLFDGIDRPQS
ncbi:MAG: restriction endonuclease [Thermodesulfobacteriota bacterium]